MSLIRFPADIEPLFSGHETFPLRQLWLRKAFAQIDTYGEVAPKEVFSAEDAIERFGVGKNMVSSIKHWALACDVIRKVGKDSFRRGEIGEVLFGKNPCDLYLERDATIWLVHWLLAGRASRSATWYVIFNFVQSQSFRSSDVLALLDEYAMANKAVRSGTTLSRDVEVCLRSYTSVSQRNATEDSAEPLLSDLGLLSMSGKDSYHFHRGDQYSLPDQIFAYALLDYWCRWESSSFANQATLSFNSIAHDYGSPGRVFKLDEDSVGDRLSRIAEITSGYLEWTDSSGIRQVSRMGSESMKQKMNEILRYAYVK
ncbi:DUF4007 family protein [Massilia sp. YIM B02763]|uniref:DUF4007 family protein n=1 Tax=Massilia sp. YIM B02763 TaxID=3050130 RepID=UPI0025B68B57|nr:DUF4007 family protein [Massilia sp. YIM B02763]MDN4056008.1 DUF4007 family protein [Massilia sp. YIM B02763]